MTGVLCQACQRTGLSGYNHPRKGPMVVEGQLPDGDELQLILELGQRAAIMMLNETTHTSWKGKR